MKLDVFTRSYCYYEIQNRILRVCEGLGYYFDSDGKYCSGKIEDLYNKMIKGIMSYYTGTYRCSLYQPDFDGVSPRIVRRAITSLKVGDDINKFFEYVETIETNRIPLPTGIDRFIGRIIGPKMAREYGNKNTKTFDFIYVDVSIIQSWETDKMEYIKQNLPEIKKRVINKIENSKNFQRYGVPVNCLRITSITLTKDDILHFIFELKKIK